jgi:multiple sugar transport system ATP-binding protein
VTHDQAEAMTLGHRVAVLKDGLLQQCDAPRALYERPANTFVAGFIGSPSMNLLTVPLGSNGSVSLGGVSIPLPAGEARRDVVVGLRPESLELAPEGVGARVEVVEEIGADAYVFCVSEVAGETTKLVARVESRRAPERGERVSLRPRPDDAHLFDPESGERLDG